MATLGNQTLGSTFTVASTWGDLAGGSYTVPSPGIIVTAINVYAGNNGTAQNARLYVWQDGTGIPANWLIRGSSLFSLGALNWQQQTALTNGAGVNSDMFLSGGTKIWIGIYFAANTAQTQANGSSGGGTEIGNPSDGNWSDHGPASLGQMGAYITYTPVGAAWVNTGTPASPIWTQGPVFVNQGTPASPNWVAASEVDVNTGTPASPIWTPGA